MQNNDVRFTIRISKDSLQALKRVADANDRSLSGEIRRAIRKAAEPPAEPQSDAEFIRGLMDTLPK